MFIRATRDTNLDKFKISKLRYMVGKDLWTIADVNIPNYDTATNTYLDVWSSYYIQVVDVTDKGYHPVSHYPEFNLRFESLDSVERGVCGLSSYEKNLSRLTSDKRLFNNVSHKDIRSDFKEIITTEELLYKMMNTEYRYR